MRSGYVSELSPYEIRHPKHPSRNNGYFERSTLSKGVLGWDAIQAHGIDMMHQGPNLARTLIHTLGNIYSGTYTASAHAHEMLLRNGRPHVRGWHDGITVNVASAPSFVDDGKDEKQSANDAGEEGNPDLVIDALGVPLSIDGSHEQVDAAHPGPPPTVIGRQPWQLSKQDQLEFDQRCESLRLPYRDSHLPALFNAEHAADFRIKSAHWWIFLGPVGVWLLLGCTSLAPIIIDIICDVLWWCHRIASKSFEPGELDEIEAEGYQVFANLELRLPIRSATIARHYLAHACWFIRRFGPLHTHWQ